MPTLKTVMSVHFSSLIYRLHHNHAFSSCFQAFLNYPPLDSVTETLGAFAPNYALWVPNWEQLTH